MSNGYVMVVNVVVFRFLMIQGGKWMEQVALKFATERRASQMKKLQEKKPTTVPPADAIATNDPKKQQ
jgi:hypothetical protein